MVIGVDGGALSIDDSRLRVGVWRVTAALLRELGQIDTTNQYSIYGFAELPKDIMSILSKSMTYRLLSPTQGWFTFRLPLELMMRPADAYLALSQSVPTGAPAKTIGFVYDINFLNHPEWYPGSAERLKQQTQALISKSAHIVTISKTVAGEIVSKFGVDIAKITVAYPGVESVFTKEGRKFMTETPYFLFVGALKPGKQIPKLLTYFARCLKKVQQVHDLYLVGGDYWLDPQIAITISELKLQERVKIIGVISDEQLAQYYRGAVAFVSASGAEGFCLPAVEAMACGCAVMTSDLPVFAEVVGEAGVQCGIDDGHKFTQALVEVAMNSAKRKKMQVAGIKKASQYTWSNFAHNIHEIITQLD